MLLHQIFRMAMEAEDPDALRQSFAWWDGRRGRKNGMEKELGPHADAIWRYAKDREKEWNMEQPEKKVKKREQNHTQQRQ